MAGPITQAVQNLLQRQQQRDQFETKFRFAEQKELSKKRLEATENARQEDLRRQVFQNNPELLGGPLRQPIPPARFNRGQPIPPSGFNPQRNGQPGAPPIPRPGQKQEIQARLQGLQKRQQENFKEFAIDNEENAKIFSQLPADVSAKLATQLRTGRTDSFARIKEQAGSFGSVAQQALSMKAGSRRNDFLTKDFETRQRLAESEGVQGPDPQRYLDIINATGNPDLQNSLLKNVVGTNRDIEKLIASKETQNKAQLERDDFALSDVFKSAAQLEGPQQDFLLREQKQAFIAEGNNRGVQEINRMLKVPAGPNRTLLMTSRAQQIEGKEVRKARLAPIAATGRILPSSQINPEGFVVKENADGTFTTTRVLNEAQLSNSDAGKFSAISTAYDNGTVLQAGPQGGIRVTDPSGKLIEAGPERVKVLEKARTEQVNFAQLQAQAKRAGTDATAQATKFFERTQKIKKSIGNIDSAIALLDKGAKTGPVLARLPSIRSLSIQLDNVQKSMGLDVIGTTTFGALSKGELDLALSKALPIGLKPAALRDWLVAKRDAQNKLTGYMESAAIFLNKPGNTIPGWLEAQKAIQENQPASPPRAQSGAQKKIGAIGEATPTGSSSNFTIKRVR